MTDKKALVLGGTGALGVYMVEELLKTGNRVDAVTIDDVVSDNPNLRYLKVDAKDNNVLDELLKKQLRCCYRLYAFISARKSFQRGI